MASTPSLPPQNSYKTSVVVIVLVGSIVHLDPRWPSSIQSYIDPLLYRLREGNHPHRIYIKYVMYSHGSSASVDPSHVKGGHDQARTLPDGTIMGESPDVAAFYSYRSIIKVIDDFQKGPKQDPNEIFSFHLWHIAAGQHDDVEYSHLDVSSAPWDRKWLSVFSQLTARDINLSMILPDRCLKLRQLFFAISHTPIGPWFYTCPHHTILLSGFVPRGGAVPLVISAGHPALLGYAPSTIQEVMALDSPPNPPAHGTQHMTDNQWSGTYPNWEHTGSDVHTQVPATDPVPNLYGGPQASSPVVAQTQPHRPGAQKLAPMSLSASPHGSGVEQQQPMPQDNTEALNAGGGLANANVGPTAQGAWSGRVYCNCDGVYIHAQAHSTEAARHPMLSTLPEDLQAEFVVAPEITTLDIQAWIRETKASVVRIDGMDNHFDQLVGALGYGRGYAVVKWEDRGLTLERLLLAPLGKSLLCAAFPDVGIPKRPQHKPPPPVRKCSPKKKKSPTAETPTSPEDPYDEAAQSTMTLPPPPQLEQSPVVYGPQGSTQGEPNPSSYRYQMGVSTQRQAMSLPQVQQVQSSLSVAMPTSPEELYVEAVHSAIAPPPPPQLLEQSPVAHYSQDSTQGDPNSSSYRDQTCVSTQHQAMSPPQVQQIQGSRAVSTPPYVEAVQRMVTPPLPQSNQYPVAYGPQGAVQGDPNSSTLWDQTGMFAQHQAMSSPQVEQVQPACAQEQWDPRSMSPDAIGADRELDDQWTDAGAADYVAGSFGVDFSANATGSSADSSFGGTSIAGSETMEGSEMDEYMDWDWAGTE